MHPATLLACRRRFGAPLLLAVAGALTVAFNLRVVGLLVVAAGFGMAGYGLARTVVPARTTLDRVLVSVTFAIATLAVVAEALSLVTLLGSPAAWIVAAGACGIVGWLLPGRRQGHGRATREDVGRDAKGRDESRL